ncbi:uncharacterized protein G2W53_008459 [Senna tora]|uniref:Uncharacterized protein n=1 Tax=Senna tora TaxID=362788 RepID=A0A834X916_9FABA|nr:uncharacterized protein G2W53_008459 [Senna tora]
MTLRFHPQRGFRPIPIRLFAAVNHESEEIEMREEEGDLPSVGTLTEGAEGIPPHCAKVQRRQEELVRK